MRMRALGATGLQLSELGLGCASYWGKKIFSQRTAIRVVHQALEAGINYLDTAPSYSGGNAEPRLGRALRGRDKTRLIVSSKVGTVIGRGGRLRKDFSCRTITNSIDNSLRALDLDALPLLLLHGPTPADLTVELLDCLARLRQQGRFRCLGVNSFDPQVLEIVAAMPQMDCLMLDYNILRQDREGLIERLHSADKGVLVGAPLASGIASGKTRLGLHGPKDIWYALRAIKNHRKHLRDMHRFEFIRDIPGWSATEIALAFVLANPHVHSAVIGTTSPDHLQANVATLGRSLPSELMERIRQA